MNVVDKHTFDISVFFPRSYGSDERMFSVLTKKNLYVVVCTFFFSVSSSVVVVVVQSLDVL